MPDHSIRLRAAWTGEFGASTSRVDLPTAWDGDRPSRPFSLLRSFRIPAIDPGETISLVMDRVPGLVSARLDGQILGEIEEGVESASFSLDSEAPRRVTLALEVDPGRWGDRVFDDGSSWGVISLAIRAS